MKSSNPKARDLFARITSLAVEEGSDRIENVCTEILAWCLLNSPEFQKSFFGLMNIPFVHCEIHTQVGFSAIIEDEADEDQYAGSRGCFDLLLLSEDGESLAVAIEVKVWSGFRENQIPDYLNALEKHYCAYRTRRLVSLTPFPEHPADVNCHIQWGHVRDALLQVNEEALRLPFAQFREFLTSRGLGYMKLDKLDQKVLQDWHAVAPTFNQWSELFEHFSNYPELKAVFKRNTEYPKFETEPDRSWLGIWSTGSAPWVYAGVGAIPSAGGVLWVSLMVPGKKAKAATNLPAPLSEPFREATKLLNHQTNESANLDKNADDGMSYFEFAQPITSEFDGESQRILKWFNSIVGPAHKFGRSLCS